MSSAGSLFPDVPRENVQFDLDQPHMEIFDTKEMKAWQVMTGLAGQSEYGFEMVPESLYVP